MKWFSFHLSDFYWPILITVSCKLGQTICLLLGKCSKVRVAARKPRRAGPRGPWAARPVLISTTNAPQRHVWGAPRSRPRRSATATHIASSSNLSQHDAIGSASNQSPLWRAEAARNCALCKASSVDSSNTCLTWVMAGVS